MTTVSDVSATTSVLESVCFFSSLFNVVLETSQGGLAAARSFDLTRTSGALSDEIAKALVSIFLTSDSSSTSSSSLSGPERSSSSIVT